MEAAAESATAGDPGVAGQPAPSATAPPPPPTPESSVEEVVNWVLELVLSGKEDIAAKVREEDVDGDAFFSFADKQEVQAALSISYGKANKLFKDRQTQGSSGV